MSNRKSNRYQYLSNEALAKRAGRVGNVRVRRQLNTVLDRRARYAAPATQDAW